jgi:ATP-dependent exoDNAse (exonuclease V) beta subunit
MKSLADAEARRRIKEDLGSTLVVEAAAGTGKTTALVSRLVALIAEGRAQLSRIIAVTFTEKAAGEMKLRLRSEVEALRTRAGIPEEQRRRLDLAVAELEVAHIGTIHAFAAELLRERPIEARVDPMFEVSPGEQSEQLYDVAFDGWFQRALADPPEGIRRVLRRRPRGRDKIGPRRELRDAGLKLAEHRDFDAPWSRPPFARSVEIDRIIARLRGLPPLAAQSKKSDDYLAKNLVEVRLFLEELDRRELVRPRDPDGLEAELRDLSRAKSWRWRGSAWSYPTGVHAEALAARDAVKADLDGLLESSDADLAACLREELRSLVGEYEAAKARSGKLDFFDLLVRARDLVLDQAAVRNDLQARFTHILVDEFQDTDPLQAEILLLLAADDPAESDWTRVRPHPGKLFVVGDPKQSIYRFRRADVALYQSVKGRLLAGGAELLHLSTSFRSVPSLQRAVNAAFAIPMKPVADEGQAAYVPLAPFRADPENQPSLIALPVPRPYGDWGKVVNFRIDDSLPDATGAFVHFLVEKSGWTVTERDDRGGEKRVPIEPRHVCLLFKRFQSFGNDVTRAYVRALETRRIPHVLIGGRSFHQREEVLAVRNAVGAIEWPDDELTVFATLRGPFFALGDDQLLAFRHLSGSLHPLRTVEKEKLAEAVRPVADALSILARLHRGRNRRPIADTLTRLLEATRAQAGIAIWPTGEQALANILRVMDLARRFEAAGATSFRAFVDRLEEDADRGEAAEAPVVEEGTEGVRMMTVHKAKGLEFPVVIVVDPTAPAMAANPSRFVDGERRLWAMPLAGCVPNDLRIHADEVLERDRQESVRLAYVAATRARDLLVVPTVGDEVIEGWLDVLNPAIHPPALNRRTPTTAPGCPAFGDDTVKERPPGAGRGPDGAVAPGQHRPQVGDHPVVWWDPKVLDLDREHDIGLRQQRILEADQGNTVADAGIRAHDAWRTQREKIIAEGSCPSLPSQTVTELALLGSTFRDAPIAIERSSDADRARPHGKRFGTLVHGIFATVALDADDAAVATLAAASGRYLGATDEEIAAASRAVASGLKHPLLLKARDAAMRGDCFREVPALLKLEDGTIADGVVDLAFRENGQWTVIDFKTDVELAPRAEEYRRQVRLYLQAMERATGEPARGVLLQV